MRIFVALVMLAATRVLSAQEDSVPHTATKATIVRSAPVTGAEIAPAIGQIAKGATVDVIGKDHDWVRIRLEGWVREADLAVADSTLRVLSAADVRANPAAAQGKLVRWDVDAVALQTADALRTGLQPGEQYLLALGPGTEKTLVYIVIPANLIQTARSLPPMAPITVVARIRNGRSEPAGVPVLDLQSFTKR
jgi:Bacterial SH3 domain.